MDLEATIFLLSYYRNTIPNKESSKAIRAHRAAPIIQPHRCVNNRISVHRCPSLPPMQISPWSGMVVAPRQENGSAMMSAIVSDRLPPAAPALRELSLEELSHIPGTDGWPVVG